MKLRKLIIPSVCIVLVACGSDDKKEDVAQPVTPPPAVEYEFSINTVNLTHGQPMSPIGAVMHSSGQLWQIGEPASSALEAIAESGDNSNILAMDIVNASVSGSDVLMPGQMQELSLITDTLNEQKFSLISMMVNTNDGFTGLSAIDVSSMVVGESKMYTTYAYDAGTEMNSEAAGTIPGPADGGEGFNVEREEMNKVAMHPGVVGQDDGLTSSVLTSQHKFDNPLLAVTVTRVK